MPTPQLKNVRPSNPLRPLFDDLNRAVLEQSNVQMGPGLGASSSPFGRLIRRTSQDYMVAMTGAGGVPAATLDDPNDPAAGRTLGEGVVYEQTVEYPGGGGVRLVPAGPDDVTEITCYNYAYSAAVEPDTLIVLHKRFGLWMVEWEECVVPA